MSKNFAYRFTFDRPINFKRVYNFLSPLTSPNNFWVPNDSSEAYIATLKFKIKNTLVSILNISFDGIINEKRFYAVTLIGDNIDTFRVSGGDIVELLELFGLM